MKFIKIQLEPYKGIQNQTYYFDSTFFHLSGPNEMGKSTLLSALKDTLFSKTSNKKVTSEVLPLTGSNFSATELHFQAFSPKENRQLTYVLKKRWGVQAQTSLDYFDTNKKLGSLIGDEEIHQVLSSFFESDLTLQQAEKLFFQGHNELQNTVALLKDNDELIYTLEKALNKDLQCEIDQQLFKIYQKLRLQTQEYFYKWDLQTNSPEKTAKGDYYKSSIGLLYKLYLKVKELQDRFQHTQYQEDHLKEFEMIIPMLEKDLLVLEKQQLESKSYLQNFIQQQFSKQQFSSLQQQLSQLKSDYDRWIRLISRIEMLREELVLKIQSVHKNEVLKQNLKHLIQLQSPISQTQLTITNQSSQKTLQLNNHFSLPPSTSWTTFINDSSILQLELAGECIQLSYPLRVISKDSLQILKSSLLEKEQEEQLYKAKTVELEELNKTLNQLENTYVHSDQLYDLLQKKQNEFQTLKTSIQEISPEQLELSISKSKQDILQNRIKIQELQQKLLEAKGKREFLLNSINENKNQNLNQNHYLKSQLDYAQKDFDFHLRRANQLQQIVLKMEATFATKPKITISQFQKNLFSTFEKSLNSLTKDYEKIPLSKMSQGTLSLYALIIRLSLAQAFWKKGHGFIVLDDPFVDLDENRLGTAYALLEQAAQQSQMQVLLTSCRNRPH